MKRTKIVATLGPATSSKEVLRDMIKNGVNVCRLNMSHGTHKDHLENIVNIRAISQEEGLHIAILADLQGPKLRVGDVEGGEMLLEEGSEISVFSGKKTSKGTDIYISYEHFSNDVQTGEKILMDDGKLMLEVLTINGEEVKAKVVVGGILKPRKGVNLPNTKISLPCLTEKDLVDLEFALSNNVDWLGLSFVRSSNDIVELRSLIEKNKNNAKIIAKIEKPEAIEDIDAIIRETDAIMVARGDLGVEIPMEQVPMVQKMLVNRSREASKPVIIATQMMETMIESTTPTRAEVNDVANAVMDGADAVMLSGETSVGKFPVKVIETICKILNEAETFEGIYNKETEPILNQDRLISDAICFNAVRLSKRIDAKGILAMTYSGYTAYKIASGRPKANIFVFTANKDILPTLSLIWGVESYYFSDNMQSTDKTFFELKSFLEKRNKVNTGDLIINIASMPIKEKGMSNMLKLSYV